MLGMSALGIETDEWACATARAAGHECLQADVAALDPRSLGPVWGVDRLAAVPGLQLGG